MSPRHVFHLVIAVIFSVAFLAVIRRDGDPDWIAQYLLATPGSDGILWQVQTTFLSVGFAGLAIAAQLFAEAPLAVGASRRRVLVHIQAGWFVGVGLAANAVIAIENVWLTSHFGILYVALFWFAPTVIMLMVSTSRLVQLFEQPSRLDEVVRTALVKTISTRLSETSSKYSDAKKPLEHFSASNWPRGRTQRELFTIRVPVPEFGRVIRKIRPRIIEQAIDFIVVRTVGKAHASGAATRAVEPPRISIEIEPGQRTRLGETAFLIAISRPLDEATAEQAARILQSSIEFEPIGSVTPDEQTDREIAILKDSVSTALRSGALGTAERALEILGHVVRGVWLVEPNGLSSTRQSSTTRQDWLFRSIGDVEQDVLLSPRIAGLFVSAAMTRTLEAPRVGSAAYVDECLRSFSRLWVDLLRHNGHEFEGIKSQITTCVQNLALYAYSVSDEQENLQTRSTWTMVELVKLALDAENVDAAIMAARELSSLFEFNRNETGRLHTRAGQLVLLAWLDYLADKQDRRSPTRRGLVELVTPRGTWADILSARGALHHGSGTLSRWERWEIESTTSIHAQILELPAYIDRAQLTALSSSHGPLPSINDIDSAMEYKRLLELLDEVENLSGKKANLKQSLSDAIAEWDAAQNDRLAEEPLSDARLEELRAAVRETLGERPQLAAHIIDSSAISDQADSSRPIHGINIRVPRHYLVKKSFNNIFADAKEPGRVIAQGFMESEEQTIVAMLKKLDGQMLAPTATAIRGQIELLGDEARHYVLVSPYGGLGDLDDWYSEESSDTLAKVTHIQTGVLDGEAILFDQRTTLACFRQPEKKDGLEPIPDTCISLGVFEDVEDRDEPQVRIEAGEYFVTWPGGAPRLTRFGTKPVGAASLGAPER